MKQDFYTGRFNERGIEILIPAAEDRYLVNSVIFGELCFGNICELSRKAFADIINKAASEGASVAILDCAEIGILIRPVDTAIPLFDTAYLYAVAAA